MACTAKPQKSRRRPKASTALMLMSVFSCPCLGSVTYPEACGLMCSMLSLQYLRHQVMVRRDQRSFLDLGEEKREPGRRHGERNHQVEPGQEEVSGQSAYILEIWDHVPEEITQTGKDDQKRHCCQLTRPPLQAAIQQKQKRQRKMNEHQHHHDRLPAMLHPRLNR